MTNSKTKIAVNVARTMFVIGKNKLVNSAMSYDVDKALAKNEVKSPTKTSIVDDFLCAWLIFI